MHSSREKFEAALKKLEQAAFQIKGGDLDLILRPDTFFQEEQDNLEPSKFDLSQKDAAIKNNAQYKSAIKALDSANDEIVRYYRVNKAFLILIEDTRTVLKEKADKSIKESTNRVQTTNDEFRSSLNRELDDLRKRVAEINSGLKVVELTTNQAKKSAGQPGKNQAAVIHEVLTNCSTLQADVDETLKFYKASKVLRSASTRTWKAARPMRSLSRSSTHRRPRCRG